MKRMTDESDRVKDHHFVLVDYPGEDPAPSDALRALRAAVPNAKLVVMTSREDQEQFADCVAAGVDGYLLKQISSEILIEFFRLVALGERVFPSALTARIPRGISDTGVKPSVLDPKAGLSPRELQVLKCLAQGSSNKGIARDLGISDTTVKVHVKNILKKIAATNRTQAAIMALNSGIIGHSKISVAESAGERFDTEPAGESLTGQAGGHDPS